jgi:hypothetical protein
MKIEEAPDWEAMASNILRAELRMRGMTQAMLVDAMNAAGTPITIASIKNKVGRGSFGFDFFLQAMSAIGADTIRIPAPYSTERSRRQAA